MRTPGGMASRIESPPPRFTRRTATVTISAPERSIAARVSSPFLYLPVPTIRRELNVFPASSKLSTLTSPHEGDDLDLIALREHALFPLLAAHDLEVHFNRDALALDRELLDQRFDRRTRFDPPRIAVDGDG